MHEAQMSLFDIKKGRDQRDQGMDLSLENAPDEWRVAADRYLDGLPIGSEFTADDLVMAAGLPRISKQNKNNVVGAFISGCARRGLIVHTDRTVYSKRVASHARRICVWRRA